MRTETFTVQYIPDAVVFYCLAFAEPPWFEVYTPADVEQEMQDVLSWDDTIAVAVFIDGRLVGVAYGFAVRRKPDVMALVDVPPEAIYVSEVFVHPEFRGRGIARRLVDALLARTENGSVGVVRTSVNQPIILRLFAERGWEVAARQDVMSEKCIDGVTVTAPDTRVVMVGRILR